jgi:hypothetical protein
MNRLKEIEIKITRKLSLKTDITNGYKAISSDGSSTCGCSTHRKTEIKFDMHNENVLPDEVLIAPSLKGYHYCEYLSEVLSHRKIEGKRNKETGHMIDFDYYRITATGECLKQRDGDEIVTNKFKFVQKIEKAELISILQQEMIIFESYIKEGKNKQHYKEMIEIIKKYT